MSDQTEIAWLWKALSETKSALSASQEREREQREVLALFHVKGCSAFAEDPTALNCCENSDAATNGLKFWRERNASQERESALREAFAKYAHHWPSCRLMHARGEPCTCGYYKVWDAQPAALSVTESDSQ